MFGAFDFQLGRDTGCALLAAMLAIKPAETRSLRDARSLIGFALFGAAQVLTNPTTGATKDVWMQNAAYIWVPFVIVGVVLAWLLLRRRGEREEEA